MLFWLYAGSLEAGYELVFSALRVRYPLPAHVIISMSILI